MPDSVRFATALRYWFTLGFVNFGGPAGQIAMMHKDLVDQRRWVDERTFLQALNFCMLLPGPEAHQLAVYLGWRLHGYLGGAVAGVCFVLPSVAIMLGLSWLAAAKGDVPAVAHIFHGIAAAVVAIVFEAVWRIGKKSLRHPVLYAYAGSAFVLGFFFSVPFPLIVLAAGIAGMLLSRSHPQVFCHRASGSRECSMAEQEAPIPLPSAWHLVRVTAVFAAIWAAVALPVFALFGLEDTLSRIILFFTQAAFVTFGGAYAVLAYIAQYAVELSWLSQAQMLLGLGLAETTPGPLIMVTQFVGFMAAWNAPGGAGGPSLGYAVAGALLTTFATFLPSFLFIFALAPYIMAITATPRLGAALTGITAAVVGVVLQLAVFFARHTFFPATSGPDWFAVVLAGAALAALVRFKTSMHVLIVGCGLLGLLWGTIP
ncbi:MAG: chromate efflux transporter [Acidobacteriota bacterium]